MASAEAAYGGDKLQAAVADLVENVEESHVSATNPVSRYVNFG